MSKTIYAYRDQLEVVLYKIIFNIDDKFLTKCITKAASNPIKYDKSTKEAFLSDIRNFFYHIDSDKRINKNGDNLTEIMGYVNMVKPDNGVFRETELKNIVETYIQLVEKPFKWDLSK